MIEIIFGSGENIDVEAQIVILPRDSNLSIAGLEKNLKENEQKKLLKLLEDDSLKDAEYIIHELKVGKKKIIYLFIKDAVNKSYSQELCQKLYEKIENSRTVCISIIKNKKNALSIRESLYNMAFELELCAYRFDKYSALKKEDFPILETIIFDVEDDGFFKGYYPYKALANAVRYGRDIYNEPLDIFDAAEFMADIKRLEYLGLCVQEDYIDGCRAAKVLWKHGNVEIQQYYARERKSAAVLIAMIKGSALLKKDINILGIINTEAYKMLSSENIKGTIIEPCSGEKEVVSGIMKFFEG